MKKFYATLDRLGIVKEEDSNFYLWDWVKSKWVIYNEGVMYTCRTDAEEITEKEAIYFIEHRIEPIVGC